MIGVDGRATAGYSYHGFAIGCDLIAVAARLAGLIYPSGSQLSLQKWYDRISLLDPSSTYTVFISDISLSVTDTDRFEGLRSKSPFMALILAHGVSTYITRCRDNRSIRYIQNEAASSGTVLWVPFWPKEVRASACGTAA